ncbi:uncharacterized protein F5147DRAFT_840526 [Suillus discolor]|uniref:Uncharacterized protein n=1 Tax=Suillus discolor TaxID=1912936 RepID=A0A9P7JNL8_9AGAM|nr:uncharacterized protein F5147DRAFT_840526 [Suillus discolor]KAG2093106.1 hypothetical protein F5147DRAFT_840526 [Suillus discolor]
MNAIHLYLSGEFDTTRRESARVPTQIRGYGRLAYGEPVEESEISCITKSLQSCWAALKQDRAPDTWGKAGNKILDEVAEEMARLHPILALCENGWKVHAIATERYPSWTATHLDKKKRKVDNTGFNDRGTSKQQKVSGPVEPESDVLKSRITGDESTSNLSEPKVKQDTPPKDIITTPILNFQNGSRSDISTSEQEQIWNGNTVDIINKISSGKKDANDETRPT